MSIVAQDFSLYVVQDALQMLHPAIPYSDVAHNLLMGTAAQESLMGTYLVQQKGPGVGIFMASPSLVHGVLAKLTPAQLAPMKQVAQGGDLTNTNQLITNLLLAAMLCRAWYWVVPAPLPPNTVSGLGAYYKMYYNTLSGAATETQWHTNFNLTGLSLPEGNTPWPS